MKIVAHTADGRFLVAVRDHPQANAVVVVGVRVSPVVALGSITAQAEGGEWIEGSGEASPERVQKVLETASGPLG